MTDETTPTDGQPSGPPPGPSLVKIVLVSLVIGVALAAILAMFGGHGSGGHGH